MKASIKKWQDNFGTEPVKVIPDQNPLSKAWEDMGQTFGKVQLEKQRYRRAGLTQAVVEIDKKMEVETKKLEEKTIDLIGYPRVEEYAKDSLKRTAESEELFLNVYKLEEYKKIPPMNVAQAIMEAKQYFERIEIWAIETEEFVRPMKDPAVIGYVKIGYREVPYLIATWGDDIKPEDLVEKKAIGGSKEDRKLLEQ